MSNAAAVIGLTYGGTDLQQSDFGIFLELVSGLNEARAVRGQDLIVPGLAGRIPRNRVLDRWPIELRGWVSGGTASGETAQRSAFRTNMLAVRTLFDPTGTPDDLELALEDGSTLTITARPLNILSDQQVPALAAVSIELEATDAAAVAVAHVAPLLFATPDDESVTLEWE